MWKWGPHKHFKFSLLILHLYSEDYFRNLQSEELFDFEALKLSITKYKNIIQINKEKIIIQVQTPKWEKSKLPHLSARTKVAI